MHGIDRNRTEICHCLSECKETWVVFLKKKCPTSPSALKRCEVLLYWLLLWLKKAFNEKVCEHLLIFPTTSWSFWSLIYYQFVHNCNVHQAAFEAWSLCASTDGLNPYLTTTMALRTVGRSKGLAARCFNRLLREFIVFLVGGWTNPSETYESNWECSPIFGVNIKIFELPPPSCCWKHRCTLIWILFGVVVGVILQYNKSWKGCTLERQVKVPILSNYHDFSTSETYPKVSCWFLHWLWAFATST